MDVAARPGAPWPAVDLALGVYGQLLVLFDGLEKLRHHLHLVLDALLPLLPRLLDCVGQILRCCGSVAASSTVGDRMGVDAHAGDGPHLPHALLGDLHVRLLPHLALLDLNDEAVSALLDLVQVLAEGAQPAIGRGPSPCRAPCRSATKLMEP